MAASRDWATFEGKPAGSDAISSGDDEIRDTKVDIRERMAVDHLWNQSVSADGWHQFLHLPGTGVLTGQTGYGILQCKTGVGTHVDLVYMSSTGSAGYIVWRGALGVGNNSYIVSGNSAGTDSINLIKSNTFGFITMGTAITPFVMATTGVCSNLNATYVAGVAPAFGAWDATKSNNTVYLAAADGFVLAYTTYASASHITGLTDSSNPPTTTRTEAQAEAGNQYILNITMPVKKGDYWKVTGASVVYWLPSST